MNGSEKWIRRIATVTTCAAALASCSSEPSPPSSDTAGDAASQAGGDVDAAPASSGGHADAGRTAGDKPSAEAGSVDPRAEDAGGKGQVDDSDDAGLSSTDPVSLDAGEAEVEVPVGSVPSELAGIWQVTRSSGGDYTNQFGQDFSATSGFSVQLKITADGQYYLAHYASGVSNDCAFVSQFDQSVGSAELSGNTLTLRPVERRIDIQDCDNTGSFDVELEPLVLTIGLAEGRQFYGGMRSYEMSVEGLSHPVVLTSLFRSPTTYEPIQPDQPADFVVGSEPPYNELQGLWAPSANSDVNFYDPETGDYYLPELNGAPHQWLRFNGQYYEGAVALQNVNSEGVCKLDLIYYERGQALFEILEDVGGQGSHFVGHTVFVAEDSRLIANIRECDEDDGSYGYTLPPLTSFFRWIYFSQDNPPESFDLVCDFPMSEWQSLLCGDGSVGFSRRE